MIKSPVEEKWDFTDPKMVQRDLVTGEPRSCNTLVPVLNVLKCYIFIWCLAKCMPRLTSNGWYRTEKTRMPV